MFCRKRSIQRGFGQFTDLENVESAGFLQHPILHERIKILSFAIFHGLIDMNDIFFKV